MISEKIKKIELQINKETIKDKYEIKFYEYCDAYEREISILYESFKADKNNLDRCFIEEENYIKKFKLKFNEFIKNEFEYIAIIVSILLLRCFTDSQNMNYDDDKKLFSNNFESDNVINTIIYNIDSFKTWLEMCYNTNSINKEYLISLKNRKAILKFIHTLSNNKLITIKTNRIGKKSLNFYILNLERKNYINIELYTEKFKIYRGKKNIYTYINHHTNMFKILKENIHSGKTIDINSNSNFFDNILKVSGFIDYELLEYYFNKKLKKEGYEKENLNYYYNTILEAIKNSINSDDKFSLVNFSSKASIILDLMRISEILNKKSSDLYYFPITLCFRGRAYFTSSISFTFHKEIRYCLHQGEYKNNEKPYFHPLNDRVNNIIDKYLYKIKELKNYNFDDKNIDTKRSILWIMISISEIEKKNLGSKISVLNFLDNAINVLNLKKTTNELDEYDDLKLKSLIKTLDEIQKDVYMKRLISKDATASVFQHLIKSLGSDTEESLKWCNLKSEDYWYDTYAFILEKWIISVSKNSYELERINKYFTRKTIKRTVMTFQYGARLNTCLKYFKEANKIEHIDDKTKEYFKNFYSFLSDNLGLVQVSPKNIVDELEKTDFMVNLKDGIKVDLNYYKCKRSQIKIMNNGDRKTKVELRLIDIKDFKKIKSSSRANYVHILDSAVIRYAISILPLLTIHDCFLIDPRNISFLISLINDVMRKSFHDLGISKKDNLNEIFSIFIII
jgi:hypothetical protein